MPVSDRFLVNAQHTRCFRETTAALYNSNVRARNTREASDLGSACGVELIEPWSMKHMKLDGFRTNTTQEHVYFSISNKLFPWRRLSAVAQMLLALSRKEAITRFVAGCTFETDPRNMWTLLVCSCHFFLRLAIIEQWIFLARGNCDLPQTATFSDVHVKTDERSRDMGRIHLSFHRTT